MKKICFMLFTLCTCFVSCSSDDDASLSSVEKMLVGKYVGSVNDVTVNYVELKSDKTGSNWTELNNSSNLPITEKVPFKWSATATQITFKGGRAPYNTTYDYTYSRGILHMVKKDDPTVAGEIHINLTKDY